MEVLSGRILLRPADLDRSVRFYSETLGLHVYREWGEGDHRGVVFFLGGGYLEVSGASQEGAPGRLEMWFQVRDLPAAHAELSAKGVVIVQPPEHKPWGLHEMCIADPDGISIVIVEVPDDHPLRRRQ